MAYETIKLGTRVVMGIPTLSTHPRSPAWIDGMAGLQMPLGSSLARKWEIDKHIAEARNLLCQTALDIGAKYLFMLGDDVIAPPNALLTLLEKVGRTFRTRDGQDEAARLITGIYWTKAYPPEPYIFRMGTSHGLLEGTYRDWLAGEFFDVDVAGCDCLILDTSVLKEVPFPWFSTDWVWEKGQPPSSIATEDYYFYTKCREYGIRIWADASIQCLHEDRETGAMFGLSMDMVQANAIPEVGVDEILIADVGAGLASIGLNGPKAKIVRFDMREEVKPDVRCDVRHLDDHWYGKFDIVNTSHVLEHFRRAEAVGLVREWMKLLKTNGKIHIHVPNFESAITKILNPPPDASNQEKAYWWGQVYGDQAEPGPPWEHKNGFTKRKLEMLLRTIPELDEIVIEEEHEGQNLKATAVLKHAVTPYVLSDAWARIRGEPTNGKVEETDLVEVKEGETYVKAT